MAQLKTRLARLIIFHKTFDRTNAVAFMAAEECIMKSYVL